MFTVLTRKEVHNLLTEGGREPVVEGWEFRNV